MGWIVDNLFPETFLKSYQTGEVLLIIGLFYTIKWVFKTLCNFHEAFKAFLLPKFWPRNFPEEYGSWAVVTGCSKGQKISKANGDVLNSSKNKQKDLPGFAAGGILFPRLLLPRRPETKV